MDVKLKQSLPKPLETEIPNKFNQFFLRDTQRGQKKIPKEYGFW